MTKNKKIKLLLIHPDRESHRQFHVPKWVGGLILLTAFGLLVTLGVFIEDYLCLRNKYVKYKALKKVIEQQNEDILHKQKQIELFSEKIDVLKSNILGLKKLENEIKSMANIKPSAKRRINKNLDTQFGVGGSYDKELEGLNPKEISPDGLVREINSQVETLYLASLNQKQSLEDLLDSLKDRETIVSSKPSRWPCKGNLSSTFGYRSSPFRTTREFHKGLDISNQLGTPVLSTGNGVVTFTGRDGLFGNVVMIDHGYGLVSKYAHLDKILVKKGETVKKGHVLGQMGRTGRTTGSHLHYEVLLNGIHVNPMNYIHN